MPRLCLGALAWAGHCRTPCSFPPSSLSRFTGPNLPRSRGLTIVTQVLPLLGRPSLQGLCRKGSLGWEVRGKGAASWGCPSSSGGTPDSALISRHGLQVGDWRGSGLFPLGPWRSYN